MDVSGGHSLRKMFQGVVTIQNLQTELSSACTSHLDPTSVCFSLYLIIIFNSPAKFASDTTNLLCLVSFPQCFFPQNLVSGIKTPMFLLNAAYDAWQVLLFFISDHSLLLSFTCIKMLYSFSQNRMRLSQSGTRELSSPIC